MTGFNSVSIPYQKVKFASYATHSRLFQANENVDQNLKLGHHSYSDKRQKVGELNTLIWHISLQYQNCTNFIQKNKMGLKYTGYDHLNDLEIKLREIGDTKLSRFNLADLHRTTNSEITHPITDKMLQVV